MTAHRPVELSVIIPCLNAEGCIATQLEALAGQQWSKSWEVLVSDNGSTDNSMQIVAAFKHRLPGLRIIDSSGRRQSSHARNVAARAAAGKVLAFCDADDEVGPGWVAGMGDALAQHDVVHGQLLYDKFSSPSEAEHLARLWEGGLHRKQFLPHAGSGNLGIRRSVHEAIGGFDESLPRFADGDYCWRLQLAGYELHYEPKAIVQCRVARVDRSLRNLFWRGWTAPAADYWSYKKFKPTGVTKDRILPSHRTFERSISKWWRVLRRVPWTVVRGDRAARIAWVEDFVMQSGEIYGQVLGRLRNPCEPYAERIPGQETVKTVSLALTSPKASAPTRLP
jgi:glycosyltransferase involved in cell wall biosynthesis